MRCELCALSLHYQTSIGRHRGCKTVYDYKARRTASHQGKVLIAGPNSKVLGVLAIVRVWQEKALQHTYRHTRMTTSDRRLAAT
jgi:hypothetical protein